MILDNFSLEGKTAVITGAGRGLGKEMAIALAEAGADVVLLSRTPTEIQAVAGRIEGLGRKAIPVATDVTSQDEVKAMVEKAIEVFGKIDILVNNAGTYIEGNFLEFTTEQWRELVSVNIEGLFICTQAVGKYMVQQKRGKVINICSMNAVRPRPKGVVYDSTKGAILTFTKALARDWARYHINVNAIGPGYFLTPLVQSLMDRDGVDENHVAKQAIPLGRLGRPEELGPLVVYLASSASDFMTGECIYIDGGTLIR